MLYDVKFDHNEHILKRYRYINVHKKTRKNIPVFIHIYLLYLNLLFISAENALMENVEKYDMIRDYVLKVCRKHL